MAKNASTRVIVGAVLGIAVAAGIAQVLVAPGLPTWRNVALSALTCLAAGILEEALFRGVLFSVLKRAFSPDEAGENGEIVTHSVQREAKRRPNRPNQSNVATPAATWKAALLQAAIFAILHINSAQLPDITWVVAAQAAAKLTAAFAFGMCMAALYVRTHTLFVPMAVHVSYDLLGVLPAEATRGLTTTYLTGALPDLIILALTAVAFSFPLVLAARVLQNPAPSPEA